jgi:hypothetical protein
MTVAARIVLAATMACLPARALAWSATVEGPDIFGVTKVLAGAEAGRENLVISCDSKDDLFIALIFPKKEFDKLTAAPAKLLLRGSTDASAITLEAQFGDWNDRFGGVVAGGRVPEIRAAIEAIAAAKSKIQIGALVNGNQISTETSSRGSTAAMAKVIEHCRIGEIALPPA